MNQIHLSCSIEGSEFRPSLLMESLPQFEILILNDPGESDLIGIDDRTVSDVGNLTIAPKEHAAMEFDRSFEDFLDGLNRLKEERAIQNVRFTLHFNIAFTSQCNFELSPSELLAMTTLGAAMTITCYQRPESLA